MLHKKWISLLDSVRHPLFLTVNSWVDPTHVFQQLHWDIIYMPCNSPFQIYNSMFFFIYSFTELSKASSNDITLEHFCPQKQNKTKQSSIPLIVTLQLFVTTALRQTLISVPLRLPPLNMSHAESHVRSALFHLSSSIRKMSSEGCPDRSVSRHFIPFHCWVIFRRMNIPHFI